MILFQSITWLNVLLPSYRYRGIVYTINIQTSTIFAGIYSIRKQHYILKIHTKFYPKIIIKSHKNFLKISPFYTQFFHFLNTQKQPKILHLRNQTTLYIPITLSIFTLIASHLII